MKLKNLILAVFVATLVLLCAFPVVVNAADVTLGIISKRQGGYGYQANTLNIWKIVNANVSGGTTTYSFDNTYYCIKGGKGFGGNSKIAEVTYNVGGKDLKKGTTFTSAERAVLPSNEKKSYSLVFEGGSETIYYTDYNAMLWILDNMYVSTAENADELKLNLFTKVFVNGEGMELDEVKLTDDDIEVVQQIALWYFTNPDESATNKYHMETLPELQVTTDDEVISADFYPLSDKNGEDMYGWERAEQAQILYNYLIKYAKVLSSKYVPSEFETNTDGNYDRVNLEIPVKLVETYPTTSISKGKCIIGPIKLIEAGTNYQLTGILRDQDNNIVSYTLLDQNKQVPNVATKLEDFAHSGEEFYLEIDDDKNTTGLTFTVNIKYTATKTYFWTVGGEEAEQQPIVEVKKIQEESEVEVKVSVERKYFDLALRKYIASKNGVATQGRVPVVNTAPLRAGSTATTAIYDHTKTPLSVETGDIILYNIAIYNEGQIDGYANEVTDYIPEGLGYIIGHSVNSENGWVPEAGFDSSSVIKLTSIPNATKYVSITDFPDYSNLSEVEVLKGKAKIKSTKLKYNPLNTNNLLEAYDEEQDVLAQPKVLSVVCVVLGNVDENTNFKNIAEISKAVDRDNYEIEDRDSVPNNVNINTYPENTNVQDDDDFENLVVKNFDLALRKFITKVGDKELTGDDDRTPLPVIKDSTGEITYVHPKNTLRVKNGDLVEYTIRVFNEGATDGYASLISDILPEGLEFVADHETNIKYKWKVSSSNSKMITTDYLSKANGDDNIIPAFNGTMPKYQDVKVVCRVNEPNNASTILINTAEIEEHQDSSGNRTIKDIDSTPGNRVKDEDDIDTESVQILIFDLALRKFISNVNDTAITGRDPKVTVDASGNIVYDQMDKQASPVEVKNNDVIIYTIRVYNEGNIDGYVEELKDDVPAGLVFLPEHEINKKYGWELQQDGTIRTTYLSSTGDAGNKLLAFNKGTMKSPDYRDVQVAFRVDESSLPQDRIIINTAEISKDKNDYNDPDIDSTPDNDKPGEDDIDKEYAKVKYFDLSLIKYIKEIYKTEAGSSTEIIPGNSETDNPEPMIQIGIHRKKINITTVDIVYIIKVTNEGEIAGYATEVVDRVPEGLVFIPESNPEWRIDDNGNVVTNQLADSLLEPGQSATVEIILRWKNGEDNIGEKTNVAEIFKDFNESDSKDIDSIPGDNVPEEDDQDDAKVIFTIELGADTSYIGIIAAGVAILAIGVVFIKKYIL